MKAELDLSRHIPHPPETVWAALLDPRADYLGDAIHVQHTGLDVDGTVQLGSHMLVQPAQGALKGIPWFLRAQIRPVTLMVAGLDQDEGMRYDTVQPNKLVGGSIGRYVESAEGGSLVVMEADLAVTSLLDCATAILPKGTTPESLVAERMDCMLARLETIAAELSPVQGGR